MFSYTKGSSGFKLKAQCHDSADVVMTDIVFAILRIHSGYILIVEKNMTVVTGQPHQVEYTFEDNEIPSKGTYACTIEVKRADGSVTVSTNKFQFQVLER